MTAVDSQNQIQINEFPIEWRPSVAQPADVDPVVAVQVYNTIPEYGEPASNNDPMLYFMGIGEGEATARKVLQFLGGIGVDNVAIAELPFMHAGIRDDDKLEARLEAVAREFTPNLAERMLARTQPADDRLLAIGRSQGAQPMFRTASENPKMFSNLVGISSFGIGIDKLGADPDARASELYRRIISNLSKQQKLDPAVITGGMELGKNMLLRGPQGTEPDRGNKYRQKVSILDRSMKAALTDAQDVTRRVVDLSHDGEHEVAIFVAKKDPLWKPNEQWNAINDAHGLDAVKVVEVEGAHVGSATKQGKDQLVQANDFVRTGVVDASKLYVGHNA